MEYELFQIEITKIYGVDAFKEDIRAMMKKAGVEGKQLVFLFTDTQIVKESFLEDVNNLLNSGEVPNLWEAEEKVDLVRDTRDYHLSLGKVDERDEIYRTFVDRVRSNLHVVLCMSPVGDALRNRCR
mmetsp:Transcript_28798/g.26015  ORF Transcript_28798/g.26015 Transcript_28798/m.26015 type:complete len:127 (-) Transcript_28798:3299-3679(-)